MKKSLLLIKYKFWSFIYKKQIFHNLKEANKHFEEMEKWREFQRNLLDAMYKFIELQKETENELDDN